MKALLSTAGTIGVISADHSRFPQFSISLMGTERPYGTHLLWKTGNGIAMNLNTLVRDMHGDWIWFMGDDHVWSQQLLMNLLAHDVDIVAPLCVMRYHPYTSNVFDVRKNGTYPAYSWKTLRQHQGLFRCAAVGGAGMLVKRAVFEALVDPWFEIGKVHPEGMWEDAYFCEKAREVGFSVYADLDSHLGHITQTILWPGDGAPDLALNDGMRLTIPEEFTQGVIA